MKNLHGNMHVFVLLCLKFTQKLKNMHVFMYFLNLESPSIPQYRIMVKGLLLRLNTEKLHVHTLYQDHYQETCRYMQ